MINKEYLVRMAASGWSVDKMATRLNVTTDEIVTALGDMAREAMAHQSNGYDDLKKAFEDLCARYNQLGKDLVGIGMGLGAVYTREEMSQVFQDSNLRWRDNASLEAVLDCIFSHTIPLKPFKPADADKIIAEEKEARRGS